MAATARADANVDVTASAPAASALLTGAAAVGLAAATPTDAAPAAPDVAATSAGDRDTIQDLYSAAFTLRELSRSQRARGVPKVEHTNYATEVGGDCSNKDTTLGDEEGHGEQQEGIGNKVAEKDLAVGDDGHRRRHHRHLSRSRSMSPSRGEKIDRRQRGAVNSRGAPSLVARASRNVVRTSAARASAADAAMSDCHAPAVENAPIVAAGATSAAMIIPTLASAPLHRTRATEALVPRQQERENALQASLSKRSAETSAAYFTKPAARALITPALMVPFLPMSQRQAALRRPSDNLREKRR